METSTGARIVVVASGIALSAALVAYYVVSYLMVRPPAVAASGTAPSASLTLQTVPSLGFGPHPGWVSYLARNSEGKWQHKCSICKQRAFNCRSFTQPNNVADHRTRVTGAAWFHEHVAADCCVRCASFATIRQ